MRTACLCLLMVTAVAADPTVSLIGTTLVVTGPADALPASVQQQLTGRLTMRWQEAPLTDVAELLRQGTGLNIVVDPRLLAEQRTVSLTAERMEAAIVLRWVGRLANIHVGWRSGAVYLAAEAPAGATVTQMYDVSDLLHGVPDFPGPELELPTPGGQVTRLIPAIEPLVTDDGAWLVDLARTQIGATP